MAPAVLVAPADRAGPVVHLVLVAPVDRVDLVDRQVLVDHQDQAALAGLVAPVGLAVADQDQVDQAVADQDLAVPVQAPVDRAGHLVADQAAFNVLETGRLIALDRVCILGMGRNGTSLQAVAHLCAIVSVKRLQALTGRSWGKSYSVLVLRLVEVLVASKKN